MYGLIEELSMDYGVNRICEVLEVSRSAYYAFMRGECGSSALERSTLANELEQLFYEHKRRYGSRRLRSALHDQGYEVGRYRVRSLMKALSLKAIQPRSFVPRTTRVDPSRARSPNLLLEMQGAPQGIKEVLVGDITYVPSQVGWLYLAVWMDLFSRQIVGWHLADHLEAQLVRDAFQKVSNKGRVMPGMIVHSDGGSQYSAAVFRTMLHKHNCRQSMTRKDNHYDNAFIESLFSRIKAELLDGQPVFVNQTDAQLKIFEYIEGYYNTHRKHSSLGYLSPRQFEMQAQKDKPKSSGFPQKASRLFGETGY